MAHTLLGTKRAGEARLRSSDGAPVFESVYHFLVKADSKTASRASILATTGLPQLGDVDVGSSLGVCRSSVAVQREDQPLYWDVTCEFSTEVKESQDNQDPGSNPTEWVPVYETKSERIQEFALKDLDNKPVVTSAGQPFENGVAITRRLPVWEFYQFEAASVTDEEVLDRCEVVNELEFKGKGPHTLKLDVLSSVIGFYYGQRLRLTRYSVTYNRNNWKHKRLDVGTVYLDGGDKKPYLDAGDPVNNIPPGVILGALDGSGNKASEAAVLEFTIYPEVDFHDFLRVPVPPEEPEEP